MTITVTNQKPAVLDPVHTISCRGDYDPVAALETTVVEPLRTPLHPGTPVSIVDDQGTDLSSVTTQMLLDCLGSTVQTQAEAKMKNVLGQTLIHFDQKTPLPVKELFAVQAGRANKLPAPGPTVIYTARDDVIPAAKGLLAGTSDDSLFFASLAYSFHPNTLGFWFRTESDFDDFKAHVRTNAAAMQSVLPVDTNTLLGEFDKLSLNRLTESLVLRRDVSDNNHELSFARLIINLLMSYLQTMAQQTQQQSTGSGAAGVLPFALDELFVPCSIVLVNVEAHARATAAKVTKEWKLINQSLTIPVKVVSNKQLAKLTSLPRAAAKAKAAQTMMNSPSQQARSAKVMFREAPPTKIDLFKDITRVLRKMKKVNHSQNIFRATRSTFLKANRRNPDDYNKPGKITSVSYLPDLHIYIDTSGSISEANYQGD